MENYQNCHLGIGAKKRVIDLRLMKVFGLVALIMAAFFFVNPVQAQSTTGLFTGVNYEGPYDWHYGVTDAEIDSDFQLFTENNIDHIVLNIIWSAFQTGINPAEYNDLNIANVKRVLTKAEQYGISVCISFFQYWMETSTGVPSWCIDPLSGNQRYIAIVRDRTIRGYFLEMIGHLVDEFKGSSSITSWSLLNEPMHSGSYSSDQLSLEREEFHLLIEEGSRVIKERDDRPISVRFTLPYSPWHTRTSGQYDTFVDFDRIMQWLDFVSINTYADPKDYGTTIEWQGTTWDDFTLALQETKSKGYTFWVSEFGSNQGKKEQTEYYRSAVQFFSNLGVDACFAWVWVHDGGDEAYNICGPRGNPKPAFYELNTEDQPPTPPSTEMSIEDWLNFWNWLKQNPPGWQKTGWDLALENQLQDWKQQTGTLEMSALDWTVFWEWLNQNPPVEIKNTQRWATVLQESLAQWKTEYL